MLVWPATNRAAAILRDIQQFARVRPAVDRRALRSATFVCHGKDLPLLEDCWRHLQQCAWCKKRYEDIRAQTVFYKNGPLPPVK